MLNSFFYFSTVCVKFWMTQSPKPSTPNVWKYVGEGLSNKYKNS